MRHAFTFLAAAICAGALAAAPKAADGPYQFIKDVEIGGEGGWDYLNLDAAGKRLLISHGTKVVVFDLTKDALAGEITDTPASTGQSSPPTAISSAATAARTRRAWST